MKPTLKPTWAPSNKPTVEPTYQPTTHPTPKPTNRPTLKPTTSNPTPRPTRRPSTEPTKQPTKFPTNLPTLRPTLQPTVRPSRSPTQSPIIPDLDHLDLYLLLDLSGSMIDHNGICSKVIIKDPDATLDGSSPSKCWQLFLSFTLKLAIEVSKLGRFRQMGWQGDNVDPSKGLRVNVIGFSCSANQKNPEVFDIIQLANSYESFYSQINDAATDYLPQGGTCPSEAIDLTTMRIIMQDRKIRPFQAALIITDGVFYDIPAPEISAQSLIYLKVQTFAVGIAIPITSGSSVGLTPDEIRLQSDQLRSFVNHVPGRVFNLGAEGFSLLEDLAFNLAQGLPRQFNRKEISTFDKWCGFTSKFACLYANGFEDYCRWFPNFGRCYPRTYCENFLPDNCRSKPDYCRWDSFDLKCRTLGVSNEGATVAPVGIFHTNFPTSTSPTLSPINPPSNTPTSFPVQISETGSPSSWFPGITEYPTIPTLRPTVGTSTKSPASLPTTPTVPGECEWSIDTITNGGEHTPDQPCSSKYASYGCRYKNYCCWDATTNICEPPKSCPECTDILAKVSCNKQSSCCNWDDSTNICNRLCLGKMEDVCI